MNYLVDAKLDNTVHDITYDQLRILYEDNLREEAESKTITESSYRGESFFNRLGNTGAEADLEYLLRDPKTAGTRIYYPHGVVIEQSARRNYYRGERSIYPASIASLLRSLDKYETRQEKELYRLVADMRVAEFRCFLQKFRHVHEWKDSDVLYEPLAQHYGLETGWLDITSDFRTALFFATCRWDDRQKEWFPLTQKEIESDEDHQYGMLFHMPSSSMTLRWTQALELMQPFANEPVENTEGKKTYQKLKYPIYRGEQQNIVYPLGFQPFMRCHMQNGYGIFMRTPHPLQKDIGFEKLRFRHSEKLSQKVFEEMQGGKLVYPHEGLKEAQFIIDEIKEETCFSYEAFQYALYRSHYYRMEDRTKALDDLRFFYINGKSIEITDSHHWKLSSGRRRKIDAAYQDFSLTDWYGVLVTDRKQIPGPKPLFEPWMIPEKEDGKGVMDFQVRDNVDCGTSIETRNMLSLLNTLKQGKISDF